MRTNLSKILSPKASAVVFSVFLAFFLVGLVLSVIQLASGTGDSVVGQSFIVLVSLLLVGITGYRLRAALRDVRRPTGRSARQ